jgi:hypothetical protein
MARINAGAIIAGAVVIGYLGFEIYSLKRLGYRTEPLFIYDRFVEARYGALACGDIDESRLAKFDQNLSSVERRALRDLREVNAQAGERQIAAMLASRRADVEADTAALIAREGCDSIEAFKLNKSFENRARLNLR